MKKDTKTIAKNVGHLADLWLPAKMMYDKTPGLVIGIAHRGELLYVNSFGYADVEKKKTMDRDTNFRIASISKIFTATAILKLVENGTLHLDDKVSHYIDWFTAKDKRKDSKNITIRQILSHSSGLFRDGDSPHWQTGVFPKDLRKSFSSKSLILENATGFKYTNYGYALLGLIIEKVSGISFDEYVRRDLFAPLKLGATHADYDDSLRDIATGYGRDIPGETRIAFRHRKTYAYAPATGFVSQVSDLARFLDILSENPRTPFLSRELKKEMERPQEKTEDGDDYGLGVDIMWQEKRKIIGHSGGFNGFMTQVSLHPESGIGVIVLCNSIASPAYGIASGIMKFVLDGLSDPLNHTGKLPDHRKYEGLYRNDWGDTVVARWGKKLVTFDPTLGSPLKSVVTLENTGKKDEFTQKGKSVFDARDEILAFRDFKKTQAQVFISGSMPSRRVQLRK